MNEKPILFNSEMVRAVFDGRKTMTRRVMKNPSWSKMDDDTFWSGVQVGYDHKLEFINCPYGRPGDLLWVRETWAAVSPHDYPAPIEECTIEYKADTGNPYPGDWSVEDARGNPDAPKWRPSIFMPRWASRLTLRVTAVRVERVQDISKKDIIAEGVNWSESFPEGYTNKLNKRGYGSAEAAFRDLWDSINAKRGYSWESNPFVWVVEFEPLT
jgi:hypothetical protein